MSIFKRKKYLEGKEKVADNNVVSLSTKTDPNDLTTSALGPAPDYDQMKNEQLEELRNYIHETESHFREVCSELNRKLERSSAENEMLREEMREWVCGDCRGIYYGGSSFMLRQVKCPNCNSANCVPKRIMKTRELQDKVAQLSSEIEYLIKNKAS